MNYEVEMVEWFYQNGICTRKTTNAYRFESIEAARVTFEGFKAILTNHTDKHGEITLWNMQGWLVEDSWAQ